MNIRRFAARNSREAMARVREALGDDAIVLNTRPCAEGIEMLAMGPDELSAAVAQEAAGARSDFVARQPVVAPVASPAAKGVASAVASHAASRAAQALASTQPASAASRADVKGDVDLLSMTTLSFQDYVRDRMQQRRKKDALGGELEARGEDVGSSPVEAPRTESPRIEARAEPRAEPRVAPRVVPRVEPRAEPRVEPRIEPRVERLAEPRVDVRTGPRSAQSSSAPIDAEPARDAAPPAADRSAQPIERAALAAVSSADIERAVKAAVDASLTALITAQARSHDVHVHAHEAQTRSNHAQTRSLESHAQVLASHTRSHEAHTQAHQAHTQAHHAQLQAHAEQTRALAAQAASQRALLAQIQRMHAAMEERFAALVAMENLRDPRRSMLSQRLFDAGFSAEQTRALVARLPDAVSDPASWAALDLERHLLTAPQGESLGEMQGVVALVGATGVGKTSCIVKVASGFVARHGAAQLGLVTLDAQRAGGHEALRAYGRAMGVAVHVAHDRASLDELLQLLANKTLVLVDTPGVSPRGEGAAELLEVLGDAFIQRVLVVAATAQGEVVEDAVQAFGGQRRTVDRKLNRGTSTGTSSAASGTASNTASNNASHGASNSASNGASNGASTHPTTDTSPCPNLHGVVLAKVDEASRIGPAIDVLIRRQLRVLGSSHGQRLTEDWHRPDAKRLLLRALRTPAPGAWRADAVQVSLLTAAKDRAIPR